MAKIQDIPCEILGLIIKDLYLASRGLRHPEWYESDSEDEDKEEGVNSFKTLSRNINRNVKRANRTFPPEMIWTDEQLCSPAKFPFNVANTCKRWRDAALMSPENWIDLQFDLAYDPRPLLGAIAASKTLSFSVNVFTTADDTTMERKSLENERAQAVVQALLLHAERCTSIVFDLTYASSLPSPVPFLARVHPELTTLVFDYKVYDLARCYEGTKIDIKPIPSPLNKLTKLSMCGSAFMDIIHLGTEWLQAQPGSNQFQSRRTCAPTLHLRDFEFPACNNEMIDGEYTIIRFIHLLHFLSPWYNVHFENISLAYHLHSNFTADVEQNNNLLEVKVSSMTLKDVSRDFIAELFQIGNLEGCSMERLYFVSCSIPRISNHIHCLTSVSLSDVPAAGALFSKTDDSLYNLTLSWDPAGRSLELNACPAFDDNFINWLADDRGDGQCEGYAISSITLRNCQNFTARAIRRLVAAVNDPVKLSSHNWNEDYKMYSLDVCGKGPRLEDEDISWFEKYKGENECELGC